MSEYLQSVQRGFALPIRRVREYPGFSATELTDMLDSFYPFQGYTLVAKHPKWVAVCDRLTAGEVMREMTVDGSVTVRVETSTAVQTLPAPRRPHVNPGQGGQV